MAKTIKVWDGSAWQDVAVGFPDTTSFATESYVDTAVGGVTIDISSAAGNGLEWDSVAQAFNVIGTPSTAVSSNISLSSNNKYFVDSSSERTLTLPSSPSLGDEIQIFDSSGSAGTNNVTIGSSNLKINGTVQDLLIDTDAGSVYLVYTGSTYGWKVL
jgi:hypothetical protein